MKLRVDVIAVVVAFVLIMCGLIKVICLMQEDFDRHHDKWVKEAQMMHDHDSTMRSLELNDYK